MVLGRREHFVIMISSRSNSSCDAVAVVVVVVVLTVIETIAFAIIVV